MTPPLPASTGYADPASPIFVPVGSAGSRRHLELLAGERDRRGEAHAARDRACRILNVFVAVAGIVVTAPVMLFVAALIKLTSSGPVIYAQPRVGLDRRGSSDRRRFPRMGSRPQRRRRDQGGRIFTIFKFRTMRTDRGGIQTWASRNDPRVTPVGRFLRATRLDELPQLFNVLRGDMNIVGPRPEQPDIFEELSRNVDDYRHRQRVLPGITGLAQVSMGYDTSVEDVRRKVRFDLEYIQRRSALEDLTIMAKTMPVIVFRRVWM